MDLLAHFTATEIPGTLAILLLGVCFGLAFGGGRIRVLPVALFAALAVLGFSGDQLGWAESARIAIDAAFLVTAGLIIVSLLSAPKRERP